MLQRYLGLGLVLLVAGAAGVLSYLEIGVDGDGDSGVLAALPEPSKLLDASSSVEVRIASAVTKQGWMEAAAKEFEKAGIETSGGSSVRFQIDPVLSGGSMRDILSGKIRPVVWSPGVSSWVQQFNETWDRRNGTSLMAEACEPTIHAPLGIAMWRPMAEALGWPDEPIGWKTIVDLAQDPDGWASLGRPEWGSFKLGHPHPVYSNVGMLFMTAAVYGVSGKTEGITPESVYDPEVEAALRALAQNTSQYGMVSLDLLNAMADQGPQVLHAIAAFENNTIQWNLERGDDLRFPLAFVFPSEGTFWTDQPYCILDRSEWVTDEQAEAARLFLDFLKRPEIQALAVEELLRPLNSSIPLASPLDLDHGTDPSVRPELVPAYEIPDGMAMQAINDQFLITKRKATVAVVLDVSDSMSGEKIKAATEATAGFINRLHPSDRVQVRPFNQKAQTMGPFSQVSDSSDRLERDIRTLFAGGGTALNRAMCSAISEMESQQRNDRLQGDSRLYGIILLSDGRDTDASFSDNQMFRSCLPNHPEAEGIKVFPIAFGDDADVEVLQQIAAVTGGTMYSADPDSLERIYLRISAEQ